MSPMSGESIGRAPSFRIKQDRIVAHPLLLTYIADQGWLDQAFIDASTSGFEEAFQANRTSVEEAAEITGLDPADSEKAARSIAEPKDGGARRRTMFSYEKGLIWGNDNYRTNGALVNLALATGNLGRPGGGCVRMGGHQEGYVRPWDAFIGRPAPYVDQLLINGQGGVHHIWGRDHHKTTLNALEFGEACHVVLPAGTSGVNLTSMNGERRMRLTERYMPPARRCRTA